MQDIVGNSIDQREKRLKETWHVGRDKRRKSSWNQRPSEYSTRVEAIHIKTPGPCLFVYSARLYGIICDCTKEQMSLAPHGQYSRGASRGETKKKSSRALERQLVHQRSKLSIPGTPATREVHMHCRSGSSLEDRFSSWYSLLFFHALAHFPIVCETFR